MENTTAGALAGLRARSAATAGIVIGLGAGAIGSAFLVHQNLTSTAYLRRSRAARFCADAGIKMGLPLVIIGVSA